MNTFERIFTEYNCADLSKKTNVPYERVKAWKRTSNIPSSYWQCLVDLGIATLEELAAAAAQKREVANG